MVNRGTGHVALEKRLAAHDVVEQRRWKSGCVVEAHPIGAALRERI